MNKLNHSQFVLRWLGCEYQRANPRGWYYKGKLIGKSTQEASLWCKNNNLGFAGAKKPDLRTEVELADLRAMREVSNV